MVKDLNRQMTIKQIQMDTEHKGESMEALIICKVTALKIFFLMFIFERQGGAERETDRI